MPDLNINVLLTFAAYAVITGLLNLLLSERSRVDAWAEAHPKVAGLLKLLRGLGLDPWHLVAAASLFFKGKLPSPPDDKDKGSKGGGSASKDPEPTRIHFERPGESFPPDEPAEMRRWVHPAWRATFVARLCAGVLVSFALGSLLATGCAAFRSVTPADRAEAYAAQAKTAELACKAYTFDLAAGLTPDVPAMTKLCAGE